MNSTVWLQITETRLRDVGRRHLYARCSPCPVVAVGVRAQAEAPTLAGHSLGNARAHHGAVDTARGWRVNQPLAVVAWISRCRRREAVLTHDLISPCGARGGRVVQRGRGWPGQRDGVVSSSAEHGRASAIVPLECRPREGSKTKIASLSSLAVLPRRGGPGARGAPSPPSRGRRSGGRTRNRAEGDGRVPAIPLHGALDGACNQPRDELGCGAPPARREARVGAAGRWGSRLTELCCSCLRGIC